MNGMRQIPYATNTPEIIHFSRLTKTGGVPGFFIPSHIIKDEMVAEGCSAIYQGLLEEYAIEDGELLTSAVEALKGVLGGLVGIEPYINPSDMYPNRFVYNGATVSPPEEHIDMCNTGLAAHLQLHTPHENRKVTLSSYYGPKPKSEGEKLTGETKEVFMGYTKPGQVTVFRGYPSPEEQKGELTPATLHKFSGHGEWVRIGW